MKIILPWHDKSLSPNARVHWAVKAKAVKIAREYAYYAALEAGYNSKYFDGYDRKIHVWLTFYPKTRNYPDADNCLSAHKAANDGIAEALSVNDRRFVVHPYVHEETGGRVEISITDDGKPWA